MLPAGKVEDVGEQLLALGRGPGGEGVGAALLQPGGMDESVKIEAQQLRDAPLCGAQPRFADEGETPPPRRGQKGRVCLRRAVRAAALPEHAVDNPVLLKIELHAHLAAALAHQFIIAAAAGPAPQRPADGVQQGGFAGAVGSAQAGELQTLEAQGIEPRARP